PERVPEPADRRQRPGVAPGAERRLEPARERDRIVTAREGGREEAPRLLDARGLDDQAGRLGGGGRLADRLAEAELEAPAMVGGRLDAGLGDAALLALLHAARHEAERAPVAEPEVVGARRAAADAHAEAAARESEVRGAARDGELERLALEHGGTPPAVPGRNHVAQARAHDLGLERAAVEEE